MRWQPVPSRCDPRLSRFYSSINHNKTAETRTVRRFTCSGLIAVSLRSDFAREIRKEIWDEEIGNIFFFLTPLETSELDYLEKSKLTFPKNDNFQVGSSAWRYQQCFRNRKSNLFFSFFKGTFLENQRWNRSQSYWHAYALDKNLT